LQGAERVEGTLETTEAAGIDERASALPTYIRAGNLYECAWELLKYGHFKGMDDEAAALALGA
jgi:hypothetical protein